MKREIKFRVWNGMEMVYDVMVGKFGIFYVNPENNGIDINDSASLSPLNTKYPDDIPLMQYTGLKDKKGVDIYEGDIIRFCDDPPYCHDYTVKYDDERMIWIAEGVGDFMEDLWELECEFVRVVGNIHDNPELIKAI